MLEYIFFYEPSMDRFIAFLKERGIAYETRKDSLDEPIVRVPDDLDETTDDAIDSFYEELMGEYEDMLAQGGDPDEQHVTALTIGLNNGRTVYAPLKPQMMNRLMQAFSSTEIQELVDSIVTAVENEDDRPLCKR
ncbi:MAG: hypothetical protein P8Y64_07805 [Gammaproteobacteria bacterium]